LENEDWQEPRLEEQFNPDRTILSLTLSPQADEKVAIKNGDKTKLAISEVKQKAIVDYLAAHSSCKAIDLSALLELNASRTKVYLKEVITDGLVIADVANRNRTYRLK